MYELKNTADNEFIKANYKVAYDLYNEALDIDKHNYEIITCKIGAALNMGYIDDVFKDSELLIKLSDKKPQVRRFQLPIGLKIERNISFTTRATI